MEDKETRYKDLHTFIIAAIALMLTVVMIIVVSSPRTSRSDTIPETDTVIETTVPIVPETTETIHIEETEVPSEAPSASVSDETIITNDQDALEMLACVIYQEAGGNKQCDECRRRVADIVLNRVADNRFPDTIYEVLTAKKQYGRFYYTGIVWPERSKYKVEQKAVERAYRIAEEVLNGQHSDLYGNGYIWQAGFKQGKDIVYCCGHYYGR